MVAQAQEGPIWTVEQYLDMEEHSTVKHEYHDGQVYAMAGGTQAHSIIAGNICSLLRVAVPGQWLPRTQLRYKDPPVSGRLCLC